MESSRPSPVWPAIAAVAVLFLGITSYLSISRHPTVSLADEAGGQPAAATTPAALAVELTEFSITPATLQAPAGQPVVITGTNVGQAEHDITLVDGPKSDTIPPGEEGSVELGSFDPGTYELICSLPGHADAGMTATLTVSTDTVADEPAAAASETSSEHAGMDHGDLTPQQMVDGHTKGVTDFVAAATGEVEPLTEGKGNQPIEPTMDGDVKVFELTADEIDWEVAPGDVKEGMALNGQIPGPRIDVNVGDTVRMVVHNELEVPTAIHPHGLIVPNSMDGVPGITQDPIMPGESFTYEFEVRNSGTHMYHSHFDSAKQVPSGLLGAFIVHEPNEPKVDMDYTMVLNDGPLGYTLNGKGFPATEPIPVKQGQKIRVRYMNEGLQIHPMHLHGIPQQVISKDGWKLPQPHMEDTVLIAPGERVDVIIDATEPGVWAYHCHILNHAEAANGMFGMVTAMIVE